jgi:hypothetical protein
MVLCVVYFLLGGVLCLQPTARLAEQLGSA